MEKRLTFTWILTGSFFFLCTLHTTVFGQETQMDDNGPGEYFAQQLIIAYEESASEAEIVNLEDTLKIRFGGEFEKECPCGPAIKLYKFPVSVNIETVRQVARSKSGVKSTERNYLINDHFEPQNQICSTPDDSYIAIKTAPIRDHIQVGYIDSGVDTVLDMSMYVNTEGPSTCLLIDNDGYDFKESDYDPEDNEDHGTAVAGIVVHNNNPGSVQIVNGKFFEESGNLFDALCATNYLIDRGDVEILNMSWGYPAEERSEALYSALQKAQLNNMLMVCAAGNEGSLIAHNRWPAGLGEDSLGLNCLIVVSSYEDCIAAPGLPPYANFGDVVDVLAPGFVNAPSTDNGLSNFRSQTGTSLSTAYVTRLGAAMMTTYSDLNCSQIANVILSTRDANRYLQPELALQEANRTSLFCADSITINNPISAGTYQAGEIWSSGLIPVLTPVTFQIDESASLLPGFTALGALEITLSICN